MGQDKLTNKIRRYRFENNEMTQEELGKRVGVTRQTVIALEQNKYTPSLMLALKIAAEFNVKVEDIFQLSNDK